MATIEQKKMVEIGCEVICGAPTTLVVKGWVRVKGEVLVLVFAEVCGLKFLWNWELIKYLYRAKVLLLTDSISYSALVWIEVDQLSH